jgi:hypothetical protein
VRGDNMTVWAYFDEPQHAFAVDYPGEITIGLYFQGELVYTSPMFLPPMGGPPHAFAGLVSETPFDSVFLYRSGSYENWVYINNVYFSTIPAPGALGAFALAALIGRRRRRHRALRSSSGATSWLS